MSTWRYVCRQIYMKVLCRYGFMCACMFVGTQKFMSVCMFICIHVCTHLYMHVHMYVHTLTWMHIWMQAFIYAYPYINTCTQTGINAQSCMSAYTYSYTSHRHGKGVTKEMKRFGALIVFGVLARTLADAQMNPGSSDVHVQWFSCQKIRADDHDITMWYHEDLSCYKGREL